MADRAFPVIYAVDVTRTAQFWECLGFSRFFQLPEGDDPGYVGMRRGQWELAVVSTEWPREHYGLTLGNGPRFEMFVYVDDVDGAIRQLRNEGVQILNEPADMPWGERVAGVADPDGNPVSLAAPIA